MPRAVPPRRPAGLRAEGLEDRITPAIAADDFYTVPANTTLSEPAPGVLGNDTSQIGPLSATLVTPPPQEHGIVTLNSDGSFVFTPAKNFVGTTSFQYRAADFTSPDTAFATIDVTNAAPEGVPDAYSTGFGQTLAVGPAEGVLANDTDPDHNGTLTASLVTAPPPQHGTLALDPDGSFTFTPAPGFFGQTSFTYVADDNIPQPPPSEPVLLAASDPTPVTITVTNQPPVTQPDAYATRQGVPLSVPAPGVLANDFDPDNSGPFTAVLAFAPPPGEGSVVLSPDGSFVFTPAPGFFGTTRFEYQASDGVNPPGEAVERVTVTVAPNRLPVTQPDTYTTPEASVLTVAAPAGVLANDADPDGDPVTAVLVQGPPPGEGTVVLNPDGSFTFAPAAGFVGTTTFTYAASDGISPPVGPQVVVITVTPVVTPHANPDTFVAAAGRPFTIPAPGVLANDTLRANPAPRVTLSGPVTDGAVTLNPDGSFTFVPAAGFTGTAGFFYVLEQGAFPPTTAPVTITVVNQPPVGQPDTYTVQGPLAVPAEAGLLANDADPDATGPLTAVLFSPPPADHGTLALAPDGSFVFTPNPEFVGPSGFVYVVSDGVSASAPVPVFFHVSGTPRPILNLFAVGAGAGGGPRVRVFERDGTPRFDVFAFEEGFRGGVRVAVGDVTGDGADDVVAAAGVGGGPRVVVFDGRTGTRIADFFAYEPTFRGGLHVAAGDVDGDGRAEIVTGVGSGGGPRVRALRPDGSEVLNFFAFDAASVAGVRVAVGNVDTDAAAEVVAAEGPSGYPVVNVFDGRTGQLELRFAVLDDDHRGGVNVAAGRGRIFVGADSVPDFAGSVFGELFPALTPDEVTSSPRVEGYSYNDIYTTKRFTTIAGQLVPTVPQGDRFLANDPGYLGGVRVSGGPAGAFDLATAPGPAGGGMVRLWRYNEAGDLEPAREFAPFEPGFLGSVYVGG